MWELASLALVLSLDNIRLAVGLGLLEASARRWWHLALMMAVVESSFPYFGAVLSPAWLPGAASLDLLGPTLLTLAAALILAGAVWKVSMRTVWLLYALPLFFGLDNLVAGAALGLPGMPGVLASLFVGAISGAISLAVMIGVGRGAALLQPSWTVAPATLTILLGLSFFFFP